MTALQHRSLLRGIYGIVDNATVDDPLAFAGVLLRAGIRVVQYRAKNGIDVAIVSRMRRLTALHGGCLIVNDDFEAALLADGWHAGQDDLAGRDVPALRARLGDRLFGISCGTPQEAQAAEQAGADYVGAGPFATTATKGDAGAPIGAPGLRAVVGATRLPVVAIGGLGAGNLAEATATGAAMAAVISALAAAPDPGFAARELVRRWSALVA